MKTAIVLAFDRLPLRLLGCYGNPESPSPNIDRFAAAAIVFDQHFAADVGDQALHGWTNDSVSTWKSAGVETHAVVEQGLAYGPSLNAFDSCWELPPENDLHGGTSGVLHAAARSVESWTGQHSPNRLVWVQSRGLCHDGQAESDPETPLHNLCQHWIARLDNGFGDLWTTVESFRQASNDELLMIVTAAEGADLGENLSLPAEIRTPAVFQRLGEAVIHTPLIVHATGSAMGTRRQTLAQTTDLWPTLCDWFALTDPQNAADGRSVMPIVREESDAVEREFLRISDGNRATAIRTRDWLLQTTPETMAAPQHPPDPQLVRLFVKPDDLWDVHNVTSQEPDQAESLLRTLQAYRDRP